MKSKTRKAVVALATGVISSIALSILVSIPLNAGVNCSGVIENQEFKCIGDSDNVCVTLLTGGVYINCYGKFTKDEGVPIH